MRIEQELVAQKIPYEILGAFKFIEREEIKDVLAFLRAILYQDNLSLLRVLGCQEKIGARTLEKIELNSEKASTSIYEYLNNNFATPADFNLAEFPVRQSERLRTAIEQINHCTEQLTTKISLTAFLTEILVNFHY